MFPMWLLPEQLANQPAVQLAIGKHLRICPERPVPVLTEGDGCKTRGRPKKGEVRPKPQQQGRFGGQGSRNVEEQIRVLQSDPEVKCIAKSHFTQLVKSTLNEVVQEREDKRDERLDSRASQDLKMTSAALSVLQDVVEAGAVVTANAFFGEGKMHLELAFSIHVCIRSFS